jgi:hypothetical protein
MINKKKLTNKTENQLTSKIRKTRKTKKYMNTPNAILDNFAILKKFHKQKQMVYMGYVDNILAFAD